MIIQIDCNAEAVVRETWTLQVPDDADVETIREEWADLLDHPEEYGAEIMGVVNGDVSDEHDRELHAIFNEAGEEL